MTELGEAFVPIRATLDKLDGDLADAKSKIQGALGGLGEGLQKAGGIALAGIVGAATAALGGLTAALGFSLAAALDNEKIQASLTQAIKASGGEAGLTAARANELAQSFMNLAGGSDDAVLGIETIAIRAGTITADQMPAFIQATLDLGAVMGDTAGAATLLARAQEDPVAAMGRLQRTGIIFSADLKKQIALMVKQGDAAGATALLMDRVAEATGGAAAANANTLSGRWEQLKGQLGEAAETIGGTLLPTLSNLTNSVLMPLIPIVSSIAAEFAAWAGDGSLEHLDNVLSLIASGFALFGFNGRDVESTLFQISDAVQTAGNFITTNIIPAIQQLIAQVQPYINMAATWIANTVQLQDVLITLGIAIAAVVIPALVAAAAPMILAIVGVMAVVVLLRQAWENDFGGIQEKTAAVWAVVQPLLAQAVQWLQVNLPIAIEALRAWWVDIAWPAIQNAIAVAWPIIQQIFQALVAFTTDILIPTIANLWTFWTTVWWPAIIAALQNAWAIIQPILAAVVQFVVGTLIPTIADLWTKWVTVWWPAISTALTNAWTIIEKVFKELDRWINTNIVPWIQALQKVWEKDVWPAIHAALTTAWAIIKPILETLGKWLSETLPPALTGLQKGFETGMSAISAAVSPVKAVWDGFVKAVSDFWNWISSHTFSFSIHLPDLPAWAIPGSPLPIHTAWKNFAEEMGRTVIQPQFNLDAMVPALGLVGQDGGNDRSVNFSSVTTVHSNADPMRVLRASRHLDKLGAMA